MSVANVVELQSVAKIIQGGRHKLSGNQFVSEGGYPAYGAGGLNGYLPIAEFDRTAVILSSIGARCGKCFLAKGQWTSLANTQVIVPDEDRADPTFLWYQLNDERRWPRAGAAQPFIKPSDVKSHKIALPPLDEQKRIAAVLNQADELRRKRQRAIERLNQLSQSIFLEMFGEWDRPGTNIPTTKLGDHLEFLTSGSRGWAEYYRDRGSLFLRIQNVRRDELDLSDVAYVEAPDTAEAKRTRVQAGDVLLSITADLGRTAVVPSTLGEAFINQHLAILRTSSLDPRYLSAALNSPAGQRTVFKRNREGVKAGLNFDDIRSVAIPDVTQKRQIEFAKRAEAVDALKIPAIHSQNELNALFSSLKHRAFHSEL